MYNWVGIQPIFRQLLTSYNELNLYIYICKSFHLITLSREVLFTLSVSNFTYLLVDSLRADT